jgi:hypothetical protein
MVDIQDFGRDHWSLLLYIQHICLNSSVKSPEGRIAEIDFNKLRINPFTNPLQSGNGRRRLDNSWKIEYGTRLKTSDSGEPRRLKDHDDWDCLNDFENSGIVEIISTVNGFVRLTEKGIDLANKLVKHIILCGATSDFVF